MFRTQIYLPKELYHQIGLIAKRNKKAKAAVIRDILKKTVEERLNQETLGDALGRLVQVGKKLNMKGPIDLSTNHDKYLYE